MSTGQAKPRFMIPSLDGIRTVAFMMVFFCHLGLHRFFPGGFGVTIFFFLSGYLISSLLRREFEQTGTISFKNFYYRRAVRILPPMFITLLFGYSLHAFGIIPGMPEIKAMMYQVFFMTNYYVAEASQLPVPVPVPAGTTVYWSLAVEEHFYMIFPFIALFLLRKAEPKRQALGLGAICAACLAWRAWMAYGLGASAWRTHMGTDTRFDSMLFGCIMGFFCNPSMDPQFKLTPARKIGLIAFSLVLGGFSATVGDSQFRETFRYTVQGIALAPLFYLAIVDHDKPWFRWLSWKPIRMLGVLSYSLYLVHWCILHALRELMPDASMLWMGILAFTLSVAYALLMYRYVEQPCARLRKRLRHTSPPESKAPDGPAPKAAPGFA